MANDSRDSFGFPKVAQDGVGLLAACVLGDTARQHYLRLQDYLLTCSNVFFELPRSGVTDYPRSPLKSSRRRVVWVRNWGGIVDQHQGVRVKCRVHTPEGEFFFFRGCGGRMGKVT